MSSPSTGGPRNCVGGDSPVTPQRNPLIVGAGPAGLTAALHLIKGGVTPRVFESSAHVGGLARTPADGDWRVDPGGHRFFTQNEAVSELWRQLLPADQWTVVPRRSAMFVDGEFVRYPLRGRDLLRHGGITNGMRGLGSLMWARMRTGPKVSNDVVNFRDWGTHQFGRRWYTTFFDNYVRKTWLTEPSELASDWANQRIKPINWRLHPDVGLDAADVFRYPRQGPGQVWEAAADALHTAGAAPVLNAEVITAKLDSDGWTLTLRDGRTATGDAVFSSMPLQNLIQALEPAPPIHIQHIAARLHHRGLITVAVALRTRYDIPFNWVYTPGPQFRCGRIQNYGRWSEDLAPAGWNGTHLGFEYFTDGLISLWDEDDDDMVRIVAADLRAIGCAVSEIEHIMIWRSQYAYPVHDATRERSVQCIREHLAEHYPSLHPMGRNGTHHYDNQDHAMLSAMQSVEKYFGSDVDPWQANTDRRYHESGLVNG